MNARSLLAEAFGTFFLVFFGCSVVAVDTLYSSFGSLWSIAAAWGVIVTLAILFTAPLSGAHLNPAITLAFATVDKFPLRRVLPYWLAQFVGAFLAAASVHLVWRPSGTIGNASNPHFSTENFHSQETAKFFGEYFSQDTPLWQAALAEGLGTYFLAFAVFAFVTSSRKKSFPASAIAPAVGLALTLLIAIFAPISMAGFNPARDLAPRCYSALAGWKEFAFQTNGHGWWIVYVIAPLLAGPIGGFSAVLLIGKPKEPKIGKT